MTCARCGITLPDGTRFCPRCGGPAVLLAQDQRSRLADQLGRPRRDTPFNLLQPAPPRPAAPVPVDNTYAWGLALVPLLIILLDVLFVQAGAAGNLTDWSMAATLAANTPLAILDSRRLQGAGVELSAWWGILIVPVYLLKRTRIAGSTPGIPLAWVASFAVYLVAAFMMLA